MAVFETRVATAADVDVANEVSAWIDEAIARGIPMLRKSPEKMFGLFQNGLSVLAVVPETGDVAAHVSLYLYDEAPDVEVGAAIRRPGNAYRGAAAVATVGAIQMARQLFPDRRIIALANDIGGKALMEKHGARKMDDSELGSHITGPCVDCPRRDKIQPGRICCDTGYDLTYSHLELS